MKQVPDCPRFSQVDQSDKQQHGHTSAHSRELHEPWFFVVTRMNVTSDLLESVNL